MVTRQLSFDDIVKAVRAKDYSPIYLLMGDETYYIDRLDKLFESTVLTEDEREMNLTILYGRDVNAEAIINEARRYPVMGAARQLVIVRELQGMDDDIDKLLAYVRRPNPTALLVLCYMNGTIDRRKKIVDEIGRMGTVYVADKMKEAQLPTFIRTYTTRRKAKIDDDAAVLLAAHVGSDLNKIANELDKLLILTRGGTIDRATVAANIGMTKEFNSFELRDAIVSRDIRRANLIARYFEEHVKSCPLQPTLAFLFSYFSNLMLAYYAPQRDAKSVAAFLKLKSEWHARDYVRGMSAFTGRKVMQIIDAIKSADARSKGVGGNNDHVLKELIYFILH